MTIPVPPIATSTFKDLVDESLRRASIHNPEWTNQTEADPGVTLIHVFAHLTEALNYRCNLIPERNRLKFLQLLQLPLRPAQAAQGLVAFSNPRGPIRTEVVNAETPLQAGRIEFRCKNGLTVLPLEGRPYIKARVSEDRASEISDLYLRLYPDLVEEGGVLDYYETKPLDFPASGPVPPPPVDLLEDTADGALWIALLARPADTVSAVRDEIAGKTLTLGVSAASDISELDILAGIADLEPGGGLLFQVPRLAGATVRYDRLDARPSANLLINPGTVELTLPDAAALTYTEALDPLEAGVGAMPPSLDGSDDALRLITWIKVTAPELDDSGSQIAARLSWVGINATEVRQRSVVPAEVLPDGTGAPGQVAQLQNVPVLPETLRVVVNGEVWQQIDDLVAAGSEATLEAAADGAERPAAKVYTVDPATGLILFGDGTFGARPQRRATIVASYAHGGGREGMVGIGAINKGTLPQGLKVVNPVPTWGGGAAETVADAEIRIPGHLRHRERLVSEQDFRDITWNTPGVDLGRVEVLALFNPAQPGVDTAGDVTLMLIPRFDPVQRETPEPDREFLKAVCRHLQPRRLVTTNLHLRGPSYRGIWVSVGVEIMAGREQGPALERVGVEIRRFLSPLAGGFNGTGWSLEKAVETAEILATVARVSGISSVREVLMGDGDGNALTALHLSGLELPRLLGLSVTRGPAAPLDALLDIAPTEEPRRLPVPVIPEDC